jgi:hypothetical protein
MNPHSFHFEEQTHGYRSGHQLLSATLKLERGDQDVVDRLSDMAGQLRPGETFTPYITGYPLPSGSYFILAKTWQDLLAPRAGCVWTHSLLIPMPAWSALTDVSDLLRFFRNTKLSEDKGHDSLAAAPEMPVADPRRFELIEALFLEERRPIVMFDCSEGETIALRVVSSLLSGLRPEFAFGTYTLAPRLIGGRPFDLLFAPSDARVRFATWPGRRIEQTKTQMEKSRHRWTADLVSRVFERGRGRLEVDEALGFSPELERVDESALRLSLRWKELVGSAAASPTAALGLLDILNARTRMPLDGTTRLFPVLNNAVTQAVTHYPPEEAWAFLTALLSKFPKGRLPAPIRKHLYWAVTMLTAKAPQAALHHLVTLEQSRREFPPLLEAWVGDGLAQTATPTPAWLWHMPERTLGRLVTASRSLARHLIDELRGQPDAGQMEMMVEIVAGTSIASRRRLLRSIASRLDQPQWVTLLTVLLQGLSGQDVARAAVELGQTTSFRVPMLDEAFVAACKSAPEPLRRAILKFEANPETDRFLSATLSLTVEDIDWVINESGLEEIRQGRLLARMVKSGSPEQVRWLAQNTKRLASVLDLLSREPSVTASAIANLIQTKPVTSELELTLGLNALPYLEGLSQTNMSEALLTFALAAPNVPAKVIASLARSLLALEYPAEQLIGKCFALQGGGQLAGRNLVALSFSDAELRQTLVQKISLLSSCLMRRYLNLGEEAYLAWAGLLSDAKTQKQRDFGELALEVLSYAFRLTAYPASPLVVATFPSAYQAIQSGTAKSSFLSTSKAKWLSQDLVRGFMDSSWPPTDFLACALLSEDPEEVFKRVGEMRNGDKYLERLEQNVTHLPATMQREALRTLSRKKKSR